MNESFMLSIFLTVLNYTSWYLMKSFIGKQLYFIYVCVYIYIYISVGITFISKEILLHRYNGIKVPLLNISKHPGFMSQHISCLFLLWFYQWGNNWPFHSSVFFFFFLFLSFYSYNPLFVCLFWLHYTTII